MPGASCDCKVNPIPGCMPHPRHAQGCGTDLREWSSLGHEDVFPGGCDNEEEAAVISESQGTHSLTYYPLRE